MKANRNLRIRPQSVMIAMLAAVAGLVLAWALPLGSAGAATTPAAAPTTVNVKPPVPQTAAQAAFHDQIRKLWEDHITWTRLAIVTFSAGTNGFPDTATRLLNNQTDIANALLKPYYGQATADKLSALLHTHIGIATEILQAAKAGDAAAATDATNRWYANANDIADFLSATNPRFWQDSVLRADMKTHLDQTLAEAVDELHGNYAASVTDYEAIHGHILAMADLLSSGIVGQFPNMFH
jgi:hypothetical protein